MAKVVNHQLFALFSVSVLYIASLLLFCVASNIVITIVSAIVVVLYTLKDDN